jgi:hypothetical protein
MGLRTISLAVVAMGLALAGAQQAAPAGGAASAAATAPAPVIAAMQSQPAGTQPASAPATQPAATRPAGPAFITIDGKEVAGKCLSIADGKATFQTQQGELSLPLAQLWVIRLGVCGELANRTGGAVICFDQMPSCQLWASGLTIDNGKLSCQSDLLGKTVIDLAQLSAVYLPSGQKLSALQAKYRELNVTRSTTDTITLDDKKGNLLPLPGVLKGLSADKVALQFEGDERQAERAGLRVLEFAALPDKPSPPQGYLVGIDGSIVPFASVSLADGQLAVTGQGASYEGAKIESVAEIRFVSTRTVNLSDSKPAAVEQSGMFDLVFPYRTDQSAAGTPLRLGGMIYSHGLGLHSRCRLSYNLDGKYVALAGLAGIDDIAAGKGNAELRIIGDERELARMALIGLEQPLPIRCDLTGVKELVILVDFGLDHVDVGDHVDLVDMRLIKP